MASGNGLPWRGPGDGRPEGIPLPPDKMPTRRGGRWRKQWRYMAAFGDEAMICAARIRVGLIGQTFWAVCDREAGKLWESTRLLLPGARGETWTELIGGEEDVVPELGDLGVVDHAPDAGSLGRVDTHIRNVGDVKGFLTFGGGKWVEAVCPADGEYVWTRKRCDVPVDVDMRIGERRWRFEGRGLEDESDGYHPHHTVWDWSAGIGRTTDGRSVGWNLVSGINDPPERSERAIWIDGEPSEPGPVTFHGLEGVSFTDGSHLDFRAEAERRKDQNLVLAKYSYRQPFGAFSGALPGGIELEHGAGVMEHHDATW